MRSSGSAFLSFPKCSSAISFPWWCPSSIDKCCSLSSLSNCRLALPTTWFLLLTFPLKNRGIAECPAQVGSAPGSTIEGKRSAEIGFKIQIFLKEFRLNGYFLNITSVKLNFQIREIYRKNFLDPKISLACFSKCPPLSRGESRIIPNLENRKKFCELQSQNPQNVKRHSR